MGPEKKTINQQCTPHSRLQRNNPGYAPAVSLEASPSMPAQCHRLSQPSFDWQSPKRFPESPCCIVFRECPWVLHRLVMRDTRELAKRTDCSRKSIEQYLLLKVAEAQQPRNAGKEETGRRMDRVGQQRTEAFLSEENAVWSLRLSGQRESTTQLGRRQKGKVIVAQSWMSLLPTVLKMKNRRTRKTDGKSNLVQTPKQFRSF